MINDIHNMGEWLIVPTDALTGFSLASGRFWLYATKTVDYFDVSRSGPRR